MILKNSSVRRKKLTPPPKHPRVKSASLISPQNPVRHDSSALSAPSAVKSSQFPPLPPVNLVNPVETSPSPSPNSFRAFGFSVVPFPNSKFKMKIISTRWGDVAAEPKLSCGGTRSPSPTCARPHFSPAKVLSGGQISGGVGKATLYFPPNTSYFVFRTSHLPPNASHFALPSTVHTTFTFVHTIHAIFVGGGRGVRPRSSGSFVHFLSALNGAPVL
jgi:hypothetical protein